MKLWSRFVLGSLVLALALGVGVSPASAAKKKKKEEKHETKHESSSSYEAPSKHYLSGTDLQGRAGLFYGQTSDAAAKGTWEGSLHAIWSSPYSGVNAFLFPVGAHFGVAKDVDVQAGASLGLLTGGGNSTSQFTLQGGAKYHIVAENRNSPDFSVGGTLYIPTYTGGQVVFMPEGTCTYVVAKNGLLLNGDFGIGISTVTYVKIDAGVGYPFSSKVTGIAEIGANQAGYTGSVLAAGARFDLGPKTKAQALLGVPLNGGGVMLGAGLILASE